MTEFTVIPVCDSAQGKTGTPRFTRSAAFAAWYSPMLRSGLRRRRAGYVDDPTEAAFLSCPGTKACTRRTAAPDVLFITSRSIKGPSPLRTRPGLPGDKSCHRRC